jgi:hypothetical protein
MLNPFIAQPDPGEASLTPDIVTAEALTWPDHAAAMTVTDAASYESAAEFVKGIKAMRKKVESAFGPIVRKAHAAWKEAGAQRKLADEPLALAEQIVKRGMAGWTSEQQRLAHVTARQDEAELRRRESEDRLAEAVALEADGEAGMAEALLAAPVIVAPVVAAPQLPTIAGISQRQVWKAQVDDLPALIAAAAQDPHGVAAGLIAVNQVALNGLARSLKGALTVPGVRVYAETSISAR